MAANKATALGPTFQYDCAGKVDMIGDRAEVKARINKKYDIRLESRKEDTHPQVNGGKPFIIATYTRNLDAGELPTPEQSFEVFKELIKEDAQFIIVKSKDGKEHAQYTKEYLQICYDRHVTGYQGTTEVEQLIHEVADVK
jgi:hypothetical protein